MIWTSCYHHYFQHGDTPVIGISRGTPKFYRGPVDLRLAPTWSMLKSDDATYQRQMLAILRKLDPQRLAKQHDGKILLCWEPPGVFCHRRMVAEWLEQKLGIEVREWGFERYETPRWTDMETKEALAEKGIKVPYAKRVVYAGVLTGDPIESGD